MPIFDTPAPIPATIDLGVGNLRIIASDRTDTIVEVRPSDPSRDIDAKTVSQTHVEFTGGRLVVKSPKHSGLFGKQGSVDVTVELPADSQVQSSSSLGDIDCEGRLGACRFKTSAGHVRLDQTGALHVNTSAGDITLDHAVGDTEVSTRTGTVRIREIDGAAVIKNSNGDSFVGEVTGELRLKAANGGIFVDTAHAAVDAKTANGDVRIGDVARGTVVLATACGELEVGIRKGSAAWLDVSSTLGTVHNSLETTEGPEPSDETVEVRARTSFGDIVIRRS